MTDFRAPIDQNKQGQQPVSEAIPNQTVQSGQTPVASPVPVVNINLQANEQTNVSQNVEIKEGPLDKLIKKLVSFIAKMTGQPDPITGAVNVPTMSGNIAQKVWTTTNNAIETVGNVAKKTVEVTSSAVDKVGDVAKKTVDVTTSTVNQVKEIKADIKASINPETKPTQPLDNLEKTE